MNIDAVDPEFRIDREKASILLGYAAGRDGRLYTTNEAVDDWLLALGGGRFGTAVEIIRKYYVSYDPQSPVPLAAITPGYIRHKAVERKAVQDRKDLKPRSPTSKSAQSASAQRGHPAKESVPSRSDTTPRYGPVAPCALSRRTADRCTGDPREVRGEITPATPPRVELGSHSSLS